jgi:hypothetical protein
VDFFIITIYNITILLILLSIWLYPFLYLYHLILHILDQFQNVILSILYNSSDISKNLSLMFFENHPVFLYLSHYSFIIIIIVIIIVIIAIIIL